MCKKDVIHLCHYDYSTMGNAIQINFEFSFTLIFRIRNVILEKVSFVEVQRIYRKSRLNDNGDRNDRNKRDRK